MSANAKNGAWRETKMAAICKPCTIKMLKRFLNSQNIENVCFKI